MYNIEITSSASKQLKKIFIEYRKGIVSKIEDLADNPHPPGSKKLRGSEYFRIRVGDYRIVYSIYEKDIKILIVRIGHRKEVYKKL